MKKLRCFLLVILVPALAHAQEKKAPPTDGPPLIFHLEAERVHFYLLFVTPDNKLLGFLEESAFQRPSVVVYDLEKKKEAHRFDGWADRAAISAGGKTLVIGFHEMRVFDWKKGELSGSFPSLKSFQLTPKGEFLVGIRPREGTSREEIHVYDVAKNKLLRSFGDLQGRVTNFSLSDDGRYVVAEHAEVWGRVGKFDRRIRHAVIVWELATGKQIDFVGTPKERIAYREKDDYWPGADLRDAGAQGGTCRVRISPTGNIMVFPRFAEPFLSAHWCKGPGRELCVQELTTGEELGRLIDFKIGRSLDFLFLNNGNTLCTAGWYKGKGAICLWDISKWQEKARQLKPASTEKEMTRLWIDLESADPMMSYRAMRKLGAAPEKSLPFLRKTLKPATAAGKDDPTDASTRQMLWAIELLEFVRNSEAREILGMLAKGDSAAWLTHEAVESLKRIGK